MDMNREFIQRQIFIKKDTYKKLVLKKLETGKTIQDLIVEAIEDSV